VTVAAVAPRRTAVVRAGASRSSQVQVLAANVDVVALVVALHPEPNIGRVERLLAIAWDSGAAPAVILTKADAVVDAEAVAEDVQAAAPGVPVIWCSASTGAGLDGVRALIGVGRTVALIGASGHGKSTLANALAGAELLRTRAIRDDGKGRHTSVRRELIVLPGGGVLIDTPGLRGVGLHRDAGALAAAFPDVDALSGDCRFRDCRHTTEPGCAVLAALATGRLSVRRWESWRRLNREARRAETRSSARARGEQGRRRPGA
jgi:ribosome biogenesis GTPase